MGDEGSWGRWDGGGGDLVLLGWGHGRWDWGDVGRWESWDRDVGHWDGDTRRLEYWDGEYGHREYWDE